MMNKFIKGRKREDKAILDTVRFGALLLDDQEQTQHFAAVGSTGSGKTTLLPTFFGR